MTHALHTPIVDLQDHGQRLDKFLALKIPECSRTRFQDVVSQGLVKIDDTTVTDASYKVKEGQDIEVTIPSLDEDPSPLPQAIPLDIVYEDDDVIVVNKPAGMVVHPAVGNADRTLVNALLSHCGDALSTLNGVKRPGIVHRLDKETSGLLVAAKNDTAHAHLTHQLRAHTMGRTYIAVVWGMVSPRFGTIEGNIGRDPRHRQRMTMRDGGKFARTHYKVLQYLGPVVSLVECRLETGRTHQIRVHLSSKGHPLLGDALYGKDPKSAPAFLKTYLQAQELWPKGRHALHARELTFVHPTTKERLCFETDLPEDMRNLLDMLLSHYKIALKDK